MTANTNPLTYNGYIQQLGIMAVVVTQEIGGVWQGGPNDSNFNIAVPQALNYAELRIQRDLDLLPSQASNSYTLTAGTNTVTIPIDDFVTIMTLRWKLIYGGVTVNSGPLLPVSREFMQNVYGSPNSAGLPQYYAMIGDTFGDGANTNNIVLIGPHADATYTIEASGTIRTPSLYKYAAAGIADTQTTYISAYYPDLLMMASMIYMSAYQRNFSATSDSPDMGASYEKQYQALRLGAIAEENRKKAQGSGWTAYSTPTAATPSR